MYYEINVSLDNVHFFATAERSLQSEEKFVKVLKAIKKKFPISEGYTISATLWQTSGRQINTNAVSHCKAHSIFFDNCIACHESNR